MNRLPSTPSADPDAAVVEVPAFVATPPVDRRKDAPEVKAMIKTTKDGKGPLNECQVCLQIRRMCTFLAVT